MPNPTPPRDLGERTFQFACDVVRLCATLENGSISARRAAGQLFDAGTSVGANYCESRNASSRRDYLRRQELVLRESRESHFWLRLIAACCMVDPPPTGLVDEANQLVCIFTTSTKTLKSSTLPSTRR